MSQRNVETLIGRMLTDEELRDRFLHDARATLDSMVAAGLELTTLEVEALVATDRNVWQVASTALDPRIVKASLGVTRKENGR